MNAHESFGEGLKETGRVAGHVVAIILGLVLMFGGIALGVTLVLLPLGIPVGLAGLYAFLWGLFARPDEKGGALPPPGVHP